MLQVGFEPNPMHKEVLDSTVSALRDSLSTEFDILYNPLNSLNSLDSIFGDNTFPIWISWESSFSFEMSEFITNFYWFYLILSIAEYLFFLSSFGFLGGTFVMLGG